MSEFYDQIQVANLHYVILQNWNKLQNKYKLNFEKLE